MVIERSGAETGQLVGALATIPPIGVGGSTVGMGVAMGLRVGDGAGVLTFLAGGPLEHAARVTSISVKASGTGVLGECWCEPQSGERARVRMMDVSFCTTIPA